MAKEQNSIHIAAYVKFHIQDWPFTATFIHSEKNMRLSAGWEDPLHPIGLCDLAKELELDLSALRDWDINLSEVKFSFDVYAEKREIAFRLVSERYGKIKLKAEGKNFFFTLQPSEQVGGFDCCKLPILGRYFQQGDCLEIQSVSVNYTSGEFHGTASGKLILFGKVVFSTGSPQNLLAAEENVKWFALDKSVGPVTLHRIGFELEGQFLDLLLDAAFHIGPITLEMIGLTLGVPVDLDFKRTVCSIEGVSVDYSSGPLHLGGGLVRSTGQEERYDGMLQLQLPGVGMSALASYAVEEDGSASLFVYAYLRFASVGIPSFEINGFAAGLGTNRRLLLPDISQVERFPLVDMATKGQPVQSTGEMLVKMGDCLKIEKDSYFGAAGISFRAFGMVNGFVLATLSFGTQFELSVMGRCEGMIPQNKKAALARLVLTFLVRFLPEQGFFSAEAMVDSGSFLLDPNCHLTGGFAMYFWFDGAHKGDFVITLGGYHPNFKIPNYYPLVDRLGVSWQIDSHVLLKGSVYFALTPAAIMAGGGLSLTYQSGNLRAWVKAQADFLVQWAPVYYEISIGVSVGASYRVDFLFIHHTFSIELGASLWLKGPPFYGRASIKWCIISFTISFGSQSSKPDVLDWNQFCQTFLPEPNPEFVPESGLEQLEGKDEWNMSRPSFSILLNCKVPVTNWHAGTQEGGQNGPALGIRPMGRDQLISQVVIRCEKDEGAGYVPAEWITEEMVQAVPKALWGNTETDLETSGLIEGAVTGFRIQSPKAEPSHATTSYPAETLMMDEAQEKEAHMARSVAIQGEDYSQEEAMEKVRHAEDQSVVQKRNQILQELVETGFDPGVLDLADFAANPQMNLRCPPLLGTLGAEENVL